MNIFKFEDLIKENLLKKNITEKQANNLLKGIETLKEITSIQEMQRNLLEEEL